MEQSFWDRGSITWFYVNSNYKDIIKTGASTPHRLPAIMASSTDAYLWLPSSRFRICWLLIESSHLLIVVFALTASIIHQLLAIPSVYENNSILSIHRETMVLSAWSYFVVGALHLATLLLDVSQSLRIRQLAFGSFSLPPSVSVLCYSFAPQPHGVLQSITKMGSVPARIWCKYFSIHGLFGAQGAQFEVFFRVRQLVVIALQTYQAYQLSCSVPRIAIVNCVVVMIVVNGFSSQMIDYLVVKNRNRTQSRIVALVVDLVVDLVVTVVVPMIVILPRILVFDLATGRYAQELIYDDGWITMAVSEAQQVLVANKLDYVSSLLPLVLSLFGLDTLKTLLRKRPRQSHLISAVAPAPTGPSHRLAGVAQNQGPDSLTPVQPLAHTLLPDRFHPVRVTTRKMSQSLAAASRSLVEVIVQRIRYLSMIWALGVLVTHVVSVTHQAYDASIHGACALVMNAWMTRRHPCAVVRLNCHRLGTTGADAKLAQVLAHFDQKSLARLVFSHCSDLHVPAIVATFSELRSFMVFNCTVASWPQTAALTRTSTPILVTVHFIDSNFTMRGFPDGIYHSQLPKGTNLLVYNSNLTTLPDTIGSVWAPHTWISFWIENTPLRELPQSFRDLKIQKLALMGTQLTALDDTVFATQNLTWLRLSRNPLTQLPVSLCSDPAKKTALTHLMVEQTNVTNLTTNVQSWLSTELTERSIGTRVVSFWGSPVCSDPMFRDICVPLDALRRDDYRYDLVVPQRAL